MERRLSVGFWGAGRDWLTHHMVVNKWKVENYQIITPSTWNSSPRDPWGQPGPYEQAVANTPILEKFSSPDDYKGLDVLRAIRSFDSCMPCAVHIEARGRILKAEATTCGCSL
jgi:hydrogenase large subunit